MWYESISAGAKVQMMITTYELLHDGLVLSLELRNLGLVCLLIWLLWLLNAIRLLLGGWSNDLLLRRGGGWSGHFRDRRVAKALKWLI